MGLLGWLTQTNPPKPVVTGPGWDRIPASYWPRKRLPNPAPLPDTRECPHCKIKGFSFRREHHVYVTSCDQCGGKRAANWFYEDDERLHHAYSFCPDCLHADHSRCWSTTTCYFGPREMAEQALAERFKITLNPTLEQTR
jgi:hypothetical protein